MEQSFGLWKDTCDTHGLVYLGGSSTPSTSKTIFVRPTNIVATIPKLVQTTTT